MSQTSALGYRVQDFEALFVQWGLEPKKARYHALQMFTWIYQRFILNPQQMSDLSLALRAKAAAELNFELPEKAFESLSSDGTRKFLFRMKDGKTVESVLIPAEDRLTLCISSQVGCAMGCNFCNTASQGLVRNLDRSEIVAQVYCVAKILHDEGLAQQVPSKKITNIVYMGMGEPLHNLENVACSLEILLEQKGFNFSKRKITVSTSGLVPALRKLNERLQGPHRVNLAISLNSSNDAQRDQVMPVNKAFPIEELLAACKEWYLEPHRRITFEYVLLKDVNDTFEDADRVLKLLKGIPYKLNVIPYNPHPASEYGRPEDSTVERFHKYLLSRNAPATVRYSRGQDILAACGQLKSKFEQAMKV